MSSDRLASFVDQGLQAGIKFIALLLLARWLTKEEFGVFALATAVSYSFAGLQRALIVLPFIVSCPTVELVKERGGPWFWLDQVLIVATTGLLVAIYGVLLLFDTPQWVQQSVLYGAVGVPAIMAYEFTRRWLYQSKKHRTILLVASANTVAYAVGLGLVYLTGPDILSAVLAFTLSTFAGSLAARLVERAPSLRSARGMFSVWLKTRSFTGWQLLGSLLSQTDHQGLNLVVGALAGPVGVAVLTAARTPLRPIGTVCSAIDLIDKPRAGRAFASGGLTQLVKSVNATRRLMLLLGAPYLAAVFIFAEPLLTLCFGDKYAGHTTELRLLIVIAFIGLLNQPAETKLVVAQRSRELFFCKLVTAIVTYSAIGVLALFLGYGLIDVIIGILVGKIVKQTLLQIAGSSLSKQHAAAAPPAAAARLQAENDDAGGAAAAGLQASAGGLDR